MAGRSAPGGPDPVRAGHTLLAAIYSFDIRPRGSSCAAFAVLMTRRESFWNFPQPSRARRPLGGPALVLNATAAPEPRPVAGFLGASAICPAERLRSGWAALCGARKLRAFIELGPGDLGEDLGGDGLASAEVLPNRSGRYAKIGGCFVGVGSNGRLCRLVPAPRPHLAPSDEDRLPPGVVRRPLGVGGFAQSGCFSRRKPLPSSHFGSTRKP